MSDDNAKAADAQFISRESEARKLATIKLARELYELMPGAPLHTINGEWDWPTIECTKHYNFCLLIAASIIRANNATFK